MFVLVVMLHMRPEVCLIVEHFPTKFTGNVLRFQMDHVYVCLQICFQVELSLAISIVTVKFGFAVNIHVFLEDTDKFESFPTCGASVTAFLI